MSIFILIMKYFKNECYFLLGSLLLLLSITEILSKHQSLGPVFLALGVEGSREMFLSVAIRVPLKKARGIPRKEKEKPITISSFNQR